MRVKGPTGRTGHGRGTVDGGRPSSKSQGKKVVRSVDLGMEGILVPMMDGVRESGTESAGVVVAVVAPAAGVVVVVNASSARPRAARPFQTR